MQSRPLKKHLLTLFKIIIAVLAIFFLSKNGLLKASSVQAFLFSSKTIWIIFLILILQTLNTVRWFALLRSQGIQIRFWRCFNLYYIGSAYNQILPGGVSGDVIKIASIAQDNLGKNKSIAGLSVVVDRVLALTACALIILFFLPEIFIKWNKVRWDLIVSENFIALYRGTLMSLVAIAVLLIFFILGNKPLYQKLLRLFSGKNVIVRFTRSMIEGIFSYRKSKMILIGNLVMATLAQVILALCLLLLGLELFTTTPSFLNYTLSNITAQIISIIPISPGGIGVGEAVFAKIFYHLNDKILLDYASIYLAFRLLNALIFLPGILLFLFLKKSQHHDK